MERKKFLTNVGYYPIVIAFLIYGGFRTFGGVHVIGQLMGWSNTDIGRSIIDALEPGFPAMSSRALIPISMFTYLSWSAVMGVVLTTGSLLALFKKRAGYWLMASYFILFGVMFINYLVFNVKVAHLAAGLVFFLIMLWLSNIPSPFGGARTERIR